MGSKKKKENELVLTIEDVFCIACRCIYLKPVTMPCGHTLCLDCFKNMVEITAYQCPTCRLRISNWLRKYKHKWDTMINEKLWAAIQKQFPLEIKKRLNDEDDGLEERIVSQGFNRISIEPGVIAKEFEDMRKQFEEEQKKIELQNLELAKRIQEEEEVNTNKLNAVIAELNQTDSKLASKIQKEMENDANYQQQLQNESDLQLAATLQSEISLALNEEKIIVGFNNKKKLSKESNSKSGPLDKMFANLKPKNDKYQHYQCRTDISMSSSSSSSFYSDTTCSSTTNSGLINEDEFLDMCTCGRLMDDNKINEPLCRFCIAQIANFELITQQHNDFLIAKDLEKKLNCSNFENYNLRKRSSPSQLPSRKIRKLPKGQQTLSFKIN
ncbi:E3 ubiquitin-protein ligase RNF168-like isoform X2 [Daktulosphaira vitifoliae]|uniref:E3 ubiquitin-protein ligase RNF168-like isoform X2 n=1 Tax=Daktulosphaira vitifoliae TaxID=58002 RepID=UPI0021A9D803|nr:E3 ubiquitin-protein ligase RNF168-like isoform X2 [Daktulosphaira vitifoliae]